MNLLKKIYQSFLSSTQPTRQEIVEAFTSALNDDTKILSDDLTHKRKRISTLQRSGSRGTDKKNSIEKPFEKEL